MSEKIRVLVVDDSFLMRQIISDIINSDPDLVVIGKAKDGKDALEKIFTLKPDVVTLDVNLPVLDGISVLGEVMKKQPTRIIMISAYTRTGATATLRALELGAIDFIAKPSGEISLDINKLKEEIISKIKLAARVEMEKVSPVLQPPVIFEKEAKPPVLKKVVVIAASTGGPKAIFDVIRDIPANIPAAFLIVQHMPIGFTLGFAERISWQSKIKAKEAEDGDFLVAGKAFVAPAGFHMGLESDSNTNTFKIKLNQDPLVNFVRPAADVTMSSVAEVFGKNTIGVVLTGMGKDGVEGARKIKEKGGVIIIQDEKTSAVWGMPRMVHEAGLDDVMLPVFEITAALAKKIES